MACKLIRAPAAGTIFAEIVAFELESGAVTGATFWRTILSDLNTTAESTRTRAKSGGFDYVGINE